MKFELDPDERKKYDEWYTRHLQEQHDGEEPYTGAIGGRVTFTITSTGLGTILGVECSVCKYNKLKERVLIALNPTSSHESWGETLTDFSDW